MATKINNRRNRRVVCNGQARAEGPKGPIKGLCRNISTGGMFFLGPTLPVGKAVDFSIELPSLGTVTAVGEIRYHHEFPEGVGMGVRFTRIAQDHLALIDRFVSGTE